MKRPELPINISNILKQLSGIFNFSRQQLMIAFGVFIVAIASAVIITVIVTVSSGSSGVRKTDDINSAAANEIIQTERPYLSDFMLIEDNLEKSFTGIVYSREILQSWSQEQIDRYWVDPEEIVADQLEEEAEKDIMDIFADVP